MVNFNFPKVWWGAITIGGWGAIALPCPYGSYGPDTTYIMEEYHALNHIYLQYGTKAYTNLYKYYTILYS